MYFDFFVYFLVQLSPRRRDLPGGMRRSCRLKEYGGAGILGGRAVGRCRRATWAVSAAIIAL